MNMSAGSCGNSPVRRILRIRLRKNRCSHEGNKLNEFTHFDYDRQDLVEINIGSNSSCKISLLRSSRINHPFIPSLSRRGLRGGQDQIFKSHGILGKLVNKSPSLCPFLSKIPLCGERACPDDEREDLEVCEELGR